MPISIHTLRLLKQQEIKELYSLPQLNAMDRDAVFSLNSREQLILDGLHTLPSKLLFILQLGFFRVGKRFYPLDELKTAEETKAYLVKRYFPAHPLEKFSLQVTKPTRLYHQKHILYLFNHRRYTRDAVLLVKRESARLADIHARPSYVVRELLRFLEREHIVVPAYSTLQNLVGMAVQGATSLLEKRADSLFTDKEKKWLDELLNKRGDFLYEVTLLKRDPRNFSLKEIKETILKRNRLDELHSSLDGFATNLGISAQNLLYYANLVSYYSIYKISRMSPITYRLLLSCFIHVRHQMINDHLVKAFLYRVNRYVEQGKKMAQEEIYRIKIGHTKKLRMAGELLKLFIDEELLPDNIPFKQVRDKAFSMIRKDDLIILASSLTEKRIDEKALEWENFDRMARKISVNIRPLVLAINFESQISSRPLEKAIKSLKKNLQEGRSLLSGVVSTEFFSKTTSIYLSPNGEIIPARYEFQLYRTLAERLISGDIFIADSLSYRSFDQDLVDGEQWKNKDAMIASLGLPKLESTPVALLDKLEKELGQLYIQVHERILTGENTHIKFSSKNKETWTLPYTKTNESLKVNVFGSMPPISLSTLLNLVNRHCAFSNAFTHVLGRYVKKSKNVGALLATITACATNMGLNKMARNANISLEEINQTYKNFVRLETLKLACDAIADSIRELPCFSGWHIDEDRIYSSSDGQKFGVSRDTYNARYSSKYFGFEKGVVAYTLNANHIPINSRIIGANEHESHFVLDILLDNTSEIKPNVHTTDSHGTNRVNFALLFLFDYIFAPRYRNLPAEAKNIYCFTGMKGYENNILRPKGKIDRGLIEQEWDNILRLAVSLATKTTSQSTIIRKLNAFPRKNKTCKALGHLDKAIKSIHILQYIDKLEFRQCIQKALNRGESYHSLKRAIFYDNLGKFRVNSEYEQNIWSECTRLVALSIIYYNSFIVSQVATRQSNLKMNVDFLKDVSPIQWKHIDLFGHFYFGDQPNKNEIECVLTAIEKLNFTLFE